jgi:hypothetical protein
VWQLNQHPVYPRPTNRIIALIDSPNVLAVDTDAGTGEFDSELCFNLPDNYSLTLSGQYRSVAFLRNHPFGTPSGGSGTGWNELAALLGKDRIGTAFSLDPSLPTVFAGTGGGSFYSGVAPMQVPNPNAQGGYDTVNTVLVTPPNLPSSLPVNYRDLWPVRLTLQGRLDSMNEMSEMTSMRLQMAMDRRSKFVETLSNMLKKIDKTQEAIIQNMN